MQFLSINTAQNVCIEYDLANPMSRIIAGIIDFMICNFGLFFVLIFLGTNSFSDVISILFTALFYFYPFLAEAFFNGNTIGKKIVNIKVIKIDGTPLTISDCLTRWIFRILEIYLSFGIIGAAAYFSSAYKQRIGDILGKTIVISINPKRHVSLSNILKIANSSNHTVTYHEITKLPESDLLILKKILDTKSNYSPTTYDTIIDISIKKVIKELDLQIKMPTDKEAFIRTLITDYVVLTR